MRRALVSVLGLSLALAVPAGAKFGMSKTKVRLNRTRPPEVALLGQTVSVDVSTRSRRVSDRQVALVEDRIKAGLGADKELRLVEGARADNVVKVSLGDLEADVSFRTDYETKYVKIGERQEYDSRTRKYVKRDVYGNRQEPVQVTTAKGSFRATIEADTPAGPKTASAQSSYDREFKGTPPQEAGSETALEEYLVDDLASEAAAAVAGGPAPVEVLLAVDGDLKSGNKYAEAGQFKEALAAWSQRTFKGDKEAARLHNVGVAHEAIAYSLPLASPEHRDELQLAAKHYKAAAEMDPGEKYFTEPNERIQVSLAYAASAQRLADEKQRHKESASHRTAAATPVPRPRTEAPAPRRGTAAPRATPRAAAATVNSSGSLALPLRNGSFESSLAPWASTGSGSVVNHPGRGKVFQAAGSATLTQPVSVDVSGEAGVSLDYKVASGEPAIRVVLGYEDAQGRARTATLEVTAGDTPGEWTPWSTDLGSVRPRAARVREVRVTVEGGTALLDNVALTLR